MKLKVEGVMVIISTEHLGRFSAIELTKMAIKGRAGAVQFRHKGTYGPEVLVTAKTASMLCRSAGIPFMINDRVDIAKIVDAAGVHLGQTDMPVAMARKILGEGKIIGGTASTLQEAQVIESAGADYMGLGHIFATPSKVKAYPPIGLDTLRTVSSSMRIPVIAIGGIGAENIGDVRLAGADGAAVISAFSGAADPLAAIRHIREKFSICCVPTSMCM